MSLSAPPCCNCENPLIGGSAVYKTVRRNKSDDTYKALANCCWCCGNARLQLTRHYKALPPGTAPIWTNSNFPWKEWRAKVDACNGICPVCTRPARMSLDHIVPFSLGGGLSIDNITPMCKSCNSRKGNRVAKAARENAKKPRKRRLQDTTETKGQTK